MATSQTVGRRPLASAARDAARAAIERPALGLYLLALAALGWKWLSPLSSLYERAGWSDALFAAAAVAWIVERARARELPRPRAFHLALALYIAAAIFSAGFAEAQGTAARNVLLVIELAVLALLTSEFASDARGRDAIVLVVTALALATSALGAVGLALFYAGVDTSLIGVYGEQFIASDLYARVAAGFDSPPLLASFCIFASAVVDLEDSPLPRRLRLLTQVALGLLVISTFSRGAIAFFAALAIRTAYSRLGAKQALRAAAATALVSVSLLAALTVGRLHLDPTRPSTVTYEVPDPGNRREAFVTGLDTLGDHPITGLGPGSLVAENRGQPFRAHLTPLNVAATMGLPALAALAFLVIVLWRERRRPTSIAIWSGLGGLMIDGLAQDIEHFRHVWVMVGLADAKREPASDEPVVELEETAQ
jgi:hypothetical protein